MTCLGEEVKAVGTTHRVRKWNPRLEEQRGKEQEAADRRSVRSHEKRITIRRRRSQDSPPARGREGSDLRKTGGRPDCYFWKMKNSRR